MKKLFLPFLALFLFPAKAIAMDLSQIAIEVRRNVNDNPSDPTRQRYNDDTLMDLVNTAQREIVNATWLSEKTTSYVLSAGTTFYNLPSDLIAVSKVEFVDTEGGIIELHETSMKKLYADNVEWRNQTGPPVDYYVTQTNISSPSLSNLSISYIPIPEATSTGTVNVHYFNGVVDISTSGNIPFDSKTQLTFYHQVIVYNVTAKIKLMEMKLQEAQLYFQLYGNELALMRDRIKSAPNFTPSMQTQGRP